MKAPYLYPNGIEYVSRIIPIAAQVKPNTKLKRPLF